jgi:hypothetical protein
MSRADRNPWLAKMVGVMLKLYVGVMFKLYVVFCVSIFASDKIKMRKIVSPARL